MVFVNTPLPHTSGLKDIYRPVALPQPVVDIATARPCLFRKFNRLVSEKSYLFDEYQNGKLSQFVGTDRLKLSLKPFFMYKPSASTCLSSFFLSFCCCLEVALTRSGRSARKADLGLL